VVPARGRTKKAATGGRIEVLLLGAMGAPAHRWEALIRGSVSPGQVLRAGNELEIHAVERRSGGRWVVDLHCAGPPLEILERLGSPPLPPYIRREWTEADRERYQTVYARPPGRRERISGSVAAPTAGLHFSPELIEKIQAQGARIAFVTLHIGPGTFRPVRCGDIRRHRMDPEPFEIPEATVQSLREARHAGGRIMAVGTSVARTLEAAAGDGDEVRTSGTTDLFIFPGYRFRVVQGLITNFHMPGSTLYMLVCAFAGVETMHAAYAEAQRLRYRFLSFGDAMVIL
jgi:S-adenosylmethionine:tRNA ribosyltransferase-isomerase